MRLTRVVAPATLPITLDAAKLHLRVTGTEEDADVTAKLTAAVEEAELRTRRSLVTQTWDLYLDAFPVGAIKLFRPPVREITHVKYLSSVDGIERTVDPGDYILDNSGSQVAWITLAKDKAWPDVWPIANAVRIRTVCGYDDGKVPTPILEWIKLCLGDMYANRERSSDRPTVPHDFAETLIHKHKVVQI